MKNHKQNRPLKNDIFTTPLYCLRFISVSNEEVNSSLCTKKEQRAYNHRAIGYLVNYTSLLFGGG